jgi:hypothetical protein
MCISLKTKGDFRWLADEVVFNNVTFADDAAPSEGCTN